MECNNSNCTAQSIGAANIAVAALIKALLAAQCALSPPELWPKDYGPIFAQNDSHVYDYIVVGGGTAGSTIAGRLSENCHYKVLLLEAGGNPPAESEIPAMATVLFVSKSQWVYPTRSNQKSCRGSLGKACLWQRGKMLGGSGAMNAMIHIRGNRRDYDNWEQLGNPSWGWDNVLQHFKKSEDYKPPNPYNLHGIGGPLVVGRFTGYPEVKKMMLKASKELGYENVDDFREGHYLGYGFTDALVINGRRNTAAKAFLKPEKSNLHVIKNALVKKINFDKENRARSVTFVYTDDINNKKIELVARTRREIVVSAGTIESPKLLMLSGIGPKKHLQEHKIPVISDLPVGNHLQDHINVGIFFEFEANEDDKLSVSSILDNTYRYLIHRDGPLASAVGPMDLVGFRNTQNKSAIYPDIQVHHVWLPKGISLLIGDSHRGGPMLQMVQVLLNPKSVGTIRLMSGNFKHKPVIRPNYFDEIEDVQTIIRNINQLLDFEKSQVFRDRKAKLVKLNIPECKNFEFRSDEYWECYIRYVSTPTYHPTGTVKMGPDSDPDAVVNPRLCVRGVKGLRVADASIMPEIVSANTNAPTIMIAEKAVDFMKEDCK